MKKIKENVFSLYFMQFCFFLFGTLILSMISWMNNNIYSSSVMTAFVFVFFYSAGWEMGNKDSRDIDGYTKNYGLAFLTSIIGNLPTIIMTALRVSAPYMYGIGTPKYGLVPQSLGKLQILLAVKSLGRAVVFGKGRSCDLRI